MSQIPEGWRSVSLGEITLESQYGMNAPSSTGGEFPMLRMNNIQDDRLDFRDLVYIHASPDELERFRLVHGDILINRTNSIDLVGKSAIFEHEGVYVFASYLVRFRLDEQQIIPKFAHYYLASEYGKASLAKIATKGVSQANINPTTLKSTLKIPLPPLPEQRAIAAILSTWDDAIALTTRLIDALKRRKQALMQRLLTGQTRFPEFVGEEWELMAFSDFAHRVGEQVDPLTSKFDLPCVELEHIESETGHLLGQTTLKAQKSLKNRFYAGQVLFGKLRPYLKKYAQPDFDGATTSEVWVLNSRNNNSNDFLFYLVQSDAFTSAANATSGTKMPRADWSLVADSVFEIPQPTEQSRIAELLKIFDTELQLHNEMEAQLHTQKRGLMQRLLTGQVRVSG